MSARQIYITAMVAGGLLCALAGCTREPAPTPAERMEAAGEQAMQRYGKALQAKQDGRYTDALTWIDSLIVVAPDLPAAYYQRGQILMELYQLEAADEAFRQTMRLDPYHWGGWYKRGHVAFEQGRYREAIRRYQRQRDVILRSPERLHRYYRQRGERALPQTWLQIGRAYEWLQRPDSAQMAYEKVLALDSTHTQAHAWLADLYDDEGRIQEALAHARRAWRHDRQNPEFAYQLGRLLLKTGRPAEALPLLERAVAARPWHAGVHYNLGRTLVALGRSEEGQRHLAVTDQLQDLDQQIDQARAAAARFPDDPARWRALARLLERARRHGEQQQALAVARALRSGGDTATAAQ